jgi:hypothetical protein
VQNSFANSLAQRDRDMQRYQMPQLSSFTEDEALQRAIATANLANSQTNPYGITSARGSGGGGGRGGGGGGGGGYALPRTAGVAAGPKATPWYSYLAPALQGIAAVAPWLLGSDTLDQIRKKGVFGWMKNPATGTMVPVDQNGYPMTDFGPTSPFGPMAGSDAATYGLLPGPNNPAPYTPYITDTSGYYPQATDMFATGLDPSYYNAPAIAPPNYGGGDIADWSNWNTPSNWSAPADASPFASSFFGP